MKEVGWRDKTFHYSQYATLDSFPGESSAVQFDEYDAMSELANPIVFGVQLPNNLRF